MSLNLGSLLSDPDFMRPFTVICRMERVDGHGRAEFTEERTAASGSVQPATPKELERLPEGDRTKETLAVFTDFPLRAGSEGDDAEGAAPDHLEWQGGVYEVVSVETWEGFCKALAQRTG